MQLGHRDNTTGWRELALDSIKAKCDPTGCYARMLTKLVAG